MSRPPLVSIPLTGPSPPPPLPPPSRPQARGSRRPEATPSASGEGGGGGGGEKEEEEEKEELIGQILELQNTLHDLSQRVNTVKEENSKLRAENQVAGG